MSICIIYRSCGFCCVSVLLVATRVYCQRSPPTVYHMRATGWEKVSSTNVAELHYQYKDEKMAQTAAA